MSLEMNKIGAAVLTAGIVAMLSGFVAKELYHPEPLKEPAFKVALPEGTAPEQPEKPSLEPILPLLASADVSEGEAQTRACQACHSFDKGGPNKVGPNLWGIVGSEPADVAGYSFSDALEKLKSEDKTWTYSNLNAFLNNPQEYAPGTKMTYSGLKNTQKRADLVAYLRSLSDDPAPLPTEAEIKAVTGAEEKAEGAASGETETASAAGGETEKAAAEASKPAEETKDAAKPSEPAAGSEDKSAEGEPATAADGTSTAAASGGDEQEASATAAKPEGTAAKPAEETGSGSDAAASDGDEKEVTETAAKPEETAAKPAEETGSGSSAAAAGETDTAASATAAKPAEETQTASAGDQGKAAAEEPTAEDAAAGGSAAAGAAGETQAASAEGGGGLSPLGQAIADASPEEGKKVARQCVACHSFEKGGPNKGGPNLYGIIGETAGAREGYNFSKAMKEKGDGGYAWTYRHLDDYLANPREVVPGTKMTFVGLKKPEQRAEVIAYIRCLAENPPPLPK